MNAATSTTQACQVMSCWRLAADGERFCAAHGGEDPPPNVNGHADLAEPIGPSCVECGYSVPGHHPECPATETRSARLPRGERQRVVLTALADGNQSPLAIATATEGDGKRVSVVLGKLVRKGLAEKVAYGAFVITDTGREALATGDGLDLGRNPSTREPQAAVEGPETTPVADSDPSAAAAVDEPQRDPILTAELPYDPAILAREAAYLRDRADALDSLAAAISNLAALTAEHEAA